MLHPWRRFSKSNEVGVFKNFKLCDLFLHLFCLDILLNVRLVFELMYKYIEIASQYIHRADSNDATYAER